MGTNICIHSLIYKNKYTNNYCLTSFIEFDIFCDIYEVHIKYLYNIYLNRNGCCGIMTKWRLNSSKSNSLMLTLSMWISPLSISVKRNKHWNKLDFPDPVLPTNPNFSPPLVWNDTPFKALDKWGWYLMFTLFIVMIPSPELVSRIFGTFNPTPIHLYKIKKTLLKT